MRKALAYLLFGIGVIASRLGLGAIYQWIMLGSSEIQGDSDNGPWSAVN